MANRQHCAQHARQRKRGEALKPITDGWGDTHRGKACVVDGCDTPQRKLQWCGRHYAAWHRHGDPSGGAYEWPKRLTECRACGAPVLPGGPREYCSDACSVATRRAATRPAESRCADCGIDIRPYRISGRAYGRGSDRYCATCRPKHRARRSYRLAVHILAHYEGAVCGLCNEPIDMTLRFPNKWSASIDHRIPLALGGTDAVDNLQLAHFSCNARREALTTPL